MYRWSFKREAQWMLWLSLPLPLLATGMLLWSWLARLL